MKRFLVTYIHDWCDAGVVKSQTEVIAESLAGCFPSVSAIMPGGTYDLKIKEIETVEDDN